MLSQGPLFGLEGECYQELKVLLNPRRAARPVGTHTFSLMRWISQDQETRQERKERREKGVQALHYSFWLQSITEITPLLFYLGAQIF